MRNIEPAILGPNQSQYVANLAGDDAHLTERQIQERLKAHAELLAKAERENWFMKPIPLTEKEYWLRRRTWRG